MSEVGYLRTMISGVPVLAAPAEIDIITAEQLRTVLLHSAAREHATMVVDVTRTRFCDLAGLTVLAQEYKRGVSGGGELRLVLAADGAVSHVMNLTCLGRLIPAFPAWPGRPPRSETARTANGSPRQRSPV